MIIRCVDVIYIILYNTIQDWKKGIFVKNKAYITRII